MTIYHIDDSRPFVQHGGQPVMWHTGGAALRSLTSSLVRISARGVVYKPAAWRLRPLPIPGWTFQACRASAEGLCETNTSLVFPSRSIPLVNERLDGLCASRETFRAVTALDRYDLSACDVLDADLDVVVARGVLLTAETRMHEWAYWAVCLLVIYLVRCLSRYVLLALSESNSESNSDKQECLSLGQRPNAGRCVLACCACVGLVVWEGTRFYVTREELLLHYFTLLYVAAYAGLFLAARASARTDPPFYNLLAGVMLCVAFRLYCGAETPYNPPLIFIIAVRVLVKSRRDHPTLTRSLTVLLDALLLSLCCSLGFGPSRHYLTALFTAAFAASDVLLDERD